MARMKSVYLKLDFFFIYVFIVLISFLVYSNKASEIKRPRGVSISKASLYIPENDFTCFDNSQTIPFTQVNDNYCDCNDGSDEPGTSACPDSFFHCTNAGHRPQNIPSSRVNDGICDCCDGTDEYDSSVVCQNNCNELGRAARIEAEKLLEVAKQGNEIRLQLSKKGKQLKQEKKEQLDQLEKDKSEAENLKTEKEGIKAQAEELESVALEQYRKIEEDRKQAEKEEELKLNEQEMLELFSLLDSNEDGKIQISELQVRQTFDQNRDGVVSEDEAKYFMEDEIEMEWESFRTSGYSRMKPYVMMEKGLFKPPPSDTTAPGDEEEVHQEGVGTVEDVTHEYQQEQQGTHEIDESELEGEENEEEEEEEEEEELPETEQEESENNDQNHTVSPDYDPETQSLVEAANKARTEFDEADRELRDIQREISQIHESLGKDYGPEEEFTPLEGECFEYTDREYKYKLCPFDQASQQSLGGGSETRLGVWGRWAGPEDDKYQAMLYERGQSCWNGPQRSTLVKLSCGVENALTSVSEPSKCEYRFEFSTPAMCRNIESYNDRSHDEL